MADWQADRLAMLVRQRAIVTSGGRLVVRQGGYVSQAESNSTMGGRLVSIQVGNVIQAKSNRHLGWQTGRQTGW